MRSRAKADRKRLLHLGPLTASRCGLLNGHPARASTRIHPLFHTSGGMSDNTTSPEALVTVYQAVAGAVSMYVGSIG